MFLQSRDMNALLLDGLRGFLGKATVKIFTLVVKNDACRAKQGLEETQECVQKHISF